jgi:hypothetical protein
MVEHPCGVCRTRFVPLIELQQYCSARCAEAAGMPGEARVVREELERRLQMSLRGGLT